MHLHKSTLEISKSALFHNYSVFKKLVSEKTKVMCVVKANAYGHGLLEVVKLLKGKADWFGVDNIEEASLIRTVDETTPILVLGYIPKSSLSVAVALQISFVVYSKEILEYIVSLQLKTKAHIHLKVETGLGRQGLYANDVLKLAQYIQKNSKYLFLEGISTHFANIEDTLDPSFSQMQLQNFQKTVDLLSINDIKPKLIHCAASAGTLLYPDTHFNLIRLGIGLYGLWPSKETRIALSLQKEKKDIQLKPVLTWKSIVAQVKEIEKGESVGYGRTWFASRKTKVAIIPVGYSDGYDRGLSNNSRVIVKGTYVPVIGRIAMNMIMVDVTDVSNVKAEDEVVLLGKMGNAEITADELALKLGTINYEIVARINPLTRKLVVK